MLLSMQRSVDRYLLLVGERSPLNLIALCLAQYWWWGSRAYRFSKTPVYESHVTNLPIYLCCFGTAASLAKAKALSTPCSNQASGLEWPSWVTWVLAEAPPRWEVGSRCAERWVWGSSVAELCPTLHDPMDHSTPGVPVLHQLLEFTQTHLRWGSDAIQPSHPLSSPAPPAINLPQHHGVFKWVSTSHQVAKVLELQHQTFQ